MRSIEPWFMGENMMSINPAGRFESETYAKVTWRLLSFIGICYLVAYIDRVNVGFAKLQMLSDLKLSEAAYGFGAGIFFIGYFLFEVPSNLIMHRVGARPWIARIMITWGIISGMVAFTGPLASAVGVSSETMFYILRFLLGVAEAGFFPGIILYFNYWYPSHRQSQALALLLAAQPVSFIIGAPLSGGIMDAFANVHGWAGWQWMYVIEAVPAVLLGLAVLFYLSNGIDDATWLTHEEKALLTSNLEGENRAKTDYPLSKLFSIGMMWVFTAIYLFIVIGVYGVNFWLPSIIKATGVQSFLMVGLITAIPYAISVGVMIIATRHAERTNEKRWHATVASILGGIGLILSAYFADNTVLTVIFITFAIAGSLTAMALFWSFPGSMLTGAAVAAGIAAINSAGNLGGFFGPSLLGWLTTWLGNSNAGLAALGGLMIVAGVLIAATCRNYGLRREEGGFATLAAAH
jgi:MFS family permease